MKRLITAPLIILTILLGILHGYTQFKSEQRALAKKKKRAEKDKKDTGWGIETKDKKNTDKDKGDKTDDKDKKPVEKKVTFDLKKVHYHFNRGGARFEKMDYSGALDEMQKALSILLLKRDKRSPYIAFSDENLQKIYLMMDRMIKRSIVYHSLVHTFKSKTRDTSRKHFIKLNKGGSFLAKNYRLVQDRVSFQVILPFDEKNLDDKFRSGERVVVPTGDIQHQEELNRKSFNQKVIDKVNRKLGLVSPDNFEVYYRMIAMCVRNGVYSPVSELLTKVLRAKNGILLIEAFAESPRGRDGAPLYDRHLLKYFWLYAENLAQNIELAASTPIRRKAKGKPTPEKTPTNGGTNPTPKPRPTPKVQEKVLEKELPEEVASVLKSARAFKRQGERYYSMIRGLRGSTRQKAVKNALKQFRLSYEFFDQVEQKFPELEGLDREITEVGKLIYDCQKLLNF